MLIMTKSPPLIVNQQVFTSAIVKIKL